MPILQYPSDFEPLPAATLEKWRSVPPAVASDCLNRTGVMHARIKPLAAGMVLCGQARTAQCMVGDNSPVHAAIRVIGPGEILVVDAAGHPGNAVFGGLLAEEMIARRAAGIVVDGAVRDRAELVDLGFPVFAAAVIPAGPHKGFGGAIDGLVSCAGCPVAPGDIVLGDDDGVTVVPLARAQQVLEACIGKLGAEQDYLRRIRDGESLADVLEIEAPRPVR